MALVNTVNDLTARGIGFKVLNGRGDIIDTTFLDGKLAFGIFPALAEFERELIIERTKRAWPPPAPGPQWLQALQDGPPKLSLAVASMNKHETRIGDRYAELGITFRMRRSIIPKQPSPTH